MMKPFWETKDPSKIKAKKIFYNPAEERIQPFRIKRRRVCKFRGCKTILRMGNKDEYCSIHEGKVNTKKRDDRLKGGKK